MASRLGQKYSELFRAAKFGIAGAVGFLIVELILTLGVYAIYHTFTIPSNSFSSPALLGLNVVAFFVGVSCAFFINERITVNNDLEGRRGGNKDLIIRLFKFQLVYVAGNAVTIGIQLALLATIGLAPSIGNIIGAIVAFPLSYYISMRVVWTRSPSGTTSAEGDASPQTDRKLER